jgi:transcription-repair coupling factor (superfamily II helicase)
MRLDALIPIIAEPCERLIAGLQSGESQAALGLRRSARLPVLAALYRGLNRPILFLTDRSERALGLGEELALWAPGANRLPFPEPTPLFYENAAWGESTRLQRLTSLTILASYHIPGAPRPKLPPLIISPARALMTRTMPRREFLKASRTLKLGQSIPPDELARTCFRLGYDAVSTVIASGQYARRGGILDLWPPAEAMPVRIEFFGDEIETMRRFDPASQRTIKSLDSRLGKLSSEEKHNAILITPAREYILSDAAPQLEEGDDYSEFWLPLLHTTPASLLDYLPRQALVIIDDYDALQSTITEFEEQSVARRQDYIRDGTLTANYPIPYLTWSEIEDTLSGQQSLQLGPPSSPIFQPIQETRSDETDSHLLADRFDAGLRFGGQLKSLMEHMAHRCQAGARLVVVSRQAARLQELWNDQRLPASVCAPSFIEGSLSEGWVFTTPDGQEIQLLTDGEIFGWRRPEPRRRVRPVAEAPEAGYSDLEIGDYVVHVDHGIGRYVGLVNRSIEGIEREYLCIEYADQAQLYVPVHQADRLTRYVGADNRSPTLSRLGSPEWRSVKSHVKEAVQEVAEDLLELYARRNIITGHAFSPDVPWQEELEASFPYIETEDQRRVLAEVKRDMQNQRPMDRLICGDVGYGKTEVALRAAFKAVMDGKQVAMLVPTTVLAQQHFNTFQHRLAAFPVIVEMLSRFRTPQQQHDIIKRLSQGAVDIVIGTHRLLSPDVQFKDLGLLIIDEEQRFGVTHKETLKKMRTEVDVLTLTATPIPRTLYMALSGVRDISTINTPPEERLPIVTHVGAYSQRLVRQAILRELERGGQVFFVHNRVQTINAMRTHLERVVPEARITIAHGQMPEAELSKRMEQFTAGEIDVLLSTSIIESGLDIPNANTLIVDRADTFGLAQLYQLRGRVGRGALRAYAYFFRHKRKPPSQEGRQRLETIAENTQLGAGFSIAMRDLEIRGTGDILGTRQHGHIAAVGFHLYTSLLAEAVRRLRKEEGLPAAPMPPSLNLQLTPVNVDLPLPISIPASYVPDKGARLGLYRRMADMRSFSELDTLMEEFNDRFGPPPETVQNLFMQLKVKLLAEKAGLSSIGVESGQIALRFPDGRIPSDLPPLDSLVRIGKTALWMPFKESIDWNEKLVDVLQTLDQA